MRQRIHRLTPLPGRAEVRLVLYLLYAMLTALLFVLLVRGLPHSEFQTPLFMAALLGLVIVGAVIFRRGRDLAEPLYWFSLMYYLLVPGAAYFLLTGFANSEHLLDFSIARTARLASVALGLLITGYIAFVTGYYASIDRSRARVVRMPTNREFANWVARIVVFAAIAIGVANFFYIITSYPGGALDYLLNFGLRSFRFEQFQQSVTTFGYQFLYAGVFLWYLIMLRSNKLSVGFCEYWVFLLAILVSIVVSISQGRMSQTVTYMLILGFLGQSLTATGQNNLKSIVWIGIVAIGGIVLYFYRKVSIALYTGKTAIGVSEFGQNIAYWLVDKGNIPNLPVLMNLLAGNGIDGEFWLGRSYALGLASPSGDLGDPVNVGQALGAHWFGQSGGVPPTIVGEAYLNFGVVGVPLVLLLTGLGAGYFYNFVKRRGSFIWYVVYFAILFKFIFMLPKGETANVVSAFWQFVPAVLLYQIVKLVSGVGRQVSFSPKYRVST